MKLCGMALLALILGHANHLQVWKNTEDLATMRVISTPAAGDTCALLDAVAFAHAAASLKDLRLKTPDAELPYTIFINETAEALVEQASILNLRSLPRRLAFDLRMPTRPYTMVDLDIHQHDFRWTASVSGFGNGDSRRIPLGEFTLFDLSERHLARSTALPLQESDFPMLHIELHGAHIDPASVQGASVPPSRRAQTLYTATAQTSILEQRGSQTVATFHVPAHVPIERIAVEIAPGSPTNFSRLVRITGRASPGSPLEGIFGTIARLHLDNLDQDQTSIPAAMGVNLQHDATVEVAVENGSEKPLAISSVRLEMRQRTICFSAPADPIALFYGDPALPAPHYSISASPQTPISAGLGPEIPNPRFHPPNDPQDRQQSRWDWWWILPLAGCGIFGTTMLHTRRNHRQ